MSRRKNGFTLIELLVVVSIIALLVSILLPALSKARDQAKRAVCMSNLHSIGQAIYMYAGDNNSRTPIHDSVIAALPGVQDALGGSGIYWMHYMIAARKMDGNLYEGGKTNLGRLVPGYLPAEATAIFCPASKSGIGGAISKYDWWKVWKDPLAYSAWPFLPSNYDYRSFYNNVPGRVKEFDGSLDRVGSKAILADMFTNYRIAYPPATWAPQAALDHHRNGYNVLMTGGDVLWISDFEQIILEMGVPWHINNAQAEEAWGWFESKTQ